MKTSKITKLILCVIIVVYLFIILHLKLWKSIMSGGKVWEIVFSIGIAITFIGLISSAFGMLFNKAIARKLFFIFNGIYLLLGCLAVYMYWHISELVSGMLSFISISGPPKFMDRIKDVAVPFLLGVVMPLGLFCYFLRPKVKSEFKKS